jgi:hypothetical protein
MPEPTSDERLRAAQGIVRLFFPERMSYLVVCLLSALTLLSTLWTNIAQNRASPAQLTLMLGSSGLITISTARILRIFDRVIDRVLPATDGTAAEGEPK